jgi:hypothetical protein
MSRMLPGGKKIIGKGTSDNPKIEILHTPPPPKPDRASSWYYNRYHRKMVG